MRAWQEGERTSGLWDAGVSSGEVGAWLEIGRAVQYWGHLSGVTVGHGQASWGFLVIGEKEGKDCRPGQGCGVAPGE